MNSDRRAGRDPALTMHEWSFLPQLGQTPAVFALAVAGLFIIGLGDDRVRVLCWLGNFMVLASAVLMFGGLEYYFWRVILKAVG